MSEPIIITIDTIGIVFTLFLFHNELIKVSNIYKIDVLFSECVLSLDPPVSTEESAPPDSPRYHLFLQRFTILF